MTKDTLDITPDPKVLIALTHTPLKPLDALCELIDNGIDSFRAARLAGDPVRHPLLEVTVPGEAQVRKGEGLVRIVDNGAGLDREGLGNTLRAGFSGKNRFDTLGLFGLGFNIATGKLGRRTTVITARAQDDFALRAVIDLPEVVKNRAFGVPVETMKKPLNFDHGTIVEVDSWWPEGDPNSGFIVQLAHIAKAPLRSQIGRRYATLLRSGDENRVRVMVNGEYVEGYEHCVWGDNRFVERQGWGSIPARITLDSVIFAQKRCVQDGTALDSGSDTCLECGDSEFRTVEERIRGWVGIQRFDDNNKFGVDLVRNGRAIRVAEKDAFFNHLNDLGEAVKEYPTDQQTGRIIGEIHLDHIPVDFQKQDFQRSSEEWQRAVSHIRGESLLPSTWPAGQRNESPISKLFQGYRKVRNYGRLDMYMGRYDEAAGKAVRINRDVEAELFDRFQKREVGFFDDTKWWEYVETATLAPRLAMEECAICGFQNRPGDEVCGDCERILHGKACLSCDVELSRSATACSSCGASQVPEVQEPWTCESCREINGVDDECCRLCTALRGAENPISVEVLRRDGELISELSVQNRSFMTADLRSTEPIDVNVFRVGPLRPTYNGALVPTVTTRASGKIDIFLDIAHSNFTQLGVRPEIAVSVEIAQYLYTLRPDLAGKPAHSVENIASMILTEVWGEQLAAGPEKVGEAIKSLFRRISERLEGNGDAADFYGELDQFEQRDLADRLISAGLLDQLSELRLNGGYLAYCGSGVLAKFFGKYPEGWFGAVWNERLADPENVGVHAAENSRQQLIGIYSRCLDDCAAYVRFSYVDPLIVTRAGASREYLELRLM
ncbi:ATP-binding protein [Cryobacterium sp. M96]|uniref:ATP-binding protein n=1 Tax=Cryobacterium sp. M96 TaxID=2048295 RepID=UPI001304FADD|nr:ATP-binding protein [Cryobacterium sp. M96]